MLFAIQPSYGPSKSLKETAFSRNKFPHIKKREKLFTRDCSKIRGSSKKYKYRSTYEVCLNCAVQICVLLSNALIMKNFVRKNLLSKKQKTKCQRKLQFKLPLYLPIFNRPKKDPKSGRHITFQTYEYDTHNAKAISRTKRNIYCSATAVFLQR